MTLASGQLFAKGHWFEPGEANTRSVVVELPADQFDVVRVDAWAGHSRYRDVPLKAVWRRENGALAAKMSILRDGVETAYDGAAREEIRTTYAVRRNEAATDLPLWSAPTASSAAAALPAPR